MPQTEYDFYQLWMKEASPWSSEGRKSYGGVRRAAGPHREALCKQHRLGPSGDVGKGQVKANFPRWPGYWHLSRSQQGPREKERKGGQEIPAEPHSLQ